MSLRSIADCLSLQIPSKQKLVLITLLNYANTDAIAWPSRELIAFNTGISPEALRPIIKWLSDNGWIQILQEGRGRGLSSRYALNLPRIEEEGQSEMENRRLLKKGVEINPFISTEKGGISTEKGGISHTKGWSPLSANPLEPVDESLNESIGRKKPQGIKQERTLVTEEWVESIRSEWEPKLIGYWRTFDQIIDWATGREYYDSTKDKQKYVLGRLEAALKDKAKKSSTPRSAAGNGTQPSSAALHNPVPKNGFEDEKAEALAKFKAARAKGYA